MLTLIIIQLILAILLVILVLLQGSDNEGLGLGGGLHYRFLEARQELQAKLQELTE